MKKETSLIERFRKWLNRNQLMETPEMPEYLYPIIGAQIDARLAREADFHDKHDVAGEQR